MSNKILVGSRYFFSCYSDCKSKDIDEVEIIETNEFKYMRQISGMGKCLFQLKKQRCAQDYIDYALQSSIGMVIGKFLIPEFCNEIGLSIEGLRELAPLIEKLDKKHKYEEIIFNSYLQNGDFILTDEQRAAAYKSYKESRGLVN